jgi:anti-sigma regulatory factor (Ser/Thr protein kinase)
VSDIVDLSMPVEADLLVLARLTAATVAARAAFGIDEIEDLRLVTEELCLSVIGDAKAGVVHLRFLRDDGAITIECSVDPDEFGEVPAAEVDELSMRIIEALVDEHGTATRGTRPCAWIRKYRGTGGA